MGLTRAPNEIHIATGKHFVNTAKPGSIDLFIIIDHTDKIATRGRNAGVQSMRPSLLLLTDVMEPSPKFRLVSFHRLACGVSGVVVRHRYGHGQIRRDFGGQQAVQSEL